MFKSLKSRFIGATIFAIILTILILTTIFSNTATGELENILESNAKKNVVFTKNYITTQYNNIVSFEAMLKESKKHELKSATDVVEAELRLVYKDYEEGLYTEDEVKASILSIVAKARYNDDKSYFWIHELTDDVPTMIAYPENPSLSNTSLDHFSYKSVVKTNENLFMHANDLVKEHGEGYIEYYWYTDTQVEKVAYVRSLDMFDWVIGTSYSKEEIDIQTMNLLDYAVEELKSISDSMLTEEGYFFIFNSDMDILIHPNAFVVDSEEDEHLMRSMMAVSDIEDEYLSYTWDHPEDKGNYIYDKKAYVSYFKPLDWYIVSTFYEDITRRPIRRIINIVVVTTLVVSLISGLIAYLIGASVTRPLRILIEKISHINYEYLPEKIDVQGSTEVMKLTDSMNNMIENIHNSRKDILDTHARLQGILDSATKMAIITTDLKGLITSFNIGAENLLGYSHEEAVNKLSVLSLHLRSEINTRCEELSEKYNKEVADFYAFITEVDETGYDEREWTFIKKDGSHIVCNLVVTRVEDGNGNGVGYLGIATDITSKKETEEKLQNRTLELKNAVRNLIAHEEHLEDMVRERTKKLEVSIRTLQDTQNQLIESEKMALLGSLVAGVAHEINTPVGIGVTLSSSLTDRTEKIKLLLDDGKLTRKQIDDYVELMSEIGKMLSRSMKQAADLVQSFKLVAVDQSVENKRQFELNDYVHEILNSFGSKFDRANIDIDVHSKEQIILNSYPGTFYQIITNLLMNSLKHGFDGLTRGHIDIYLDQDDEAYHISYQDDGVGIEVEELDKIFEPFYTTKRHEGGTGLGLNIVNNLVIQKLKGKIVTESKVGQGVLFKITIPRQEV
ncbi:PAS domain S-box protein [Acidaminobacter sp. JC074]|uniref:cache domain-containing protein n=1 Tax=Acidaminobacter sp. JC074 TaxID=2530199 RepID=UPI001F0E247C|nr:cache domain-containing protein [Acidaminobacter sp. JC074]MCH4888424.1 PAS domain S-box protein [Acidaminobacter sp. JC074]